jgi:Xaa-Pro aminopeptidase
MYPERLAQMQKWLQTVEAAALLIPRSDEYVSFPTAPYAERLAWMSGFLGSAGTLVVTRHQAVLFTDARYAPAAAEGLNASGSNASDSNASDSNASALEAQGLKAQELKTTVFEVWDTARCSLSQWLEKNLPPNSSVVYDPWLHTVSQIEALEKTLGMKQLVLSPTTPHPVDVFWTDQPPRPLAPLWVHPDTYAGETAASKCARIARTLPPESVFFFSAKDSICWLLNLRGEDVPDAPLFNGYAALTSCGQVHVFVETSKVTRAVREHLGEKGVFSQPSSLPDVLPLLAQGKTLLWDPDETPAALVQLATTQGIPWRAHPNPCLLPKSLKNKTELSHIRADHVTEALAIVALLHWLETQAPLNRTCGEWDVAAKIEELRRRAPLYWGPSFDSIVGFGPHSAMIHFKPTAQDQFFLAQKGLLLMDTGGQYKSGTTTDMTRTLCLGSPSEEEKDIFTRVLRGHIQLSRVVFPQGTKGCHLDALARMPLWEAGLDCVHSIGHGVGSFLKVHESPPGFSRHSDKTSLMEGMVITIEPGYYKLGHFGVRLENMVEIVPKPDGEGGDTFLGFEPLTLVPFDHSLILPERLTPQETAWLNGYHQRVFETLSPHLDGKTAQWLRAKTRPLEERRGTPPTRG